MGISSGIQDVLITQISSIDAGKSIQLMPLNESSAAKTENRKCVAIYPIIKDDGVYARLRAEGGVTDYSFKLKEFWWKVVEFY